MRQTNKRTAAGTLAVLLLAAYGTGCGRGGGYERYVPTAPAARAALETALAAWQNGLPAGEINAGAGRLQVVDSHRRPGQRLRRYTVLGEVVAADGPRCFAVRLDLENPGEMQKVRFYVIGIEPIWVYRQEDHDMMMHWECPPADEKKGEVKTVQAR